MPGKVADLAGPGVSTYEEVEKILPSDYTALQPPLERMKAVAAVKEYIEKNLCRELNLTMVQVPLIVTRESGVNDYLDRNGSRTPIGPWSTIASRSASAAGSARRGRSCTCCAPPISAR